MNRPDPIALLPVVVDTSDRLYDDFIRFLFLHVDRETSVLTNELPEDSDQFHFLSCGTCFTTLKGDVGLIMVKPSALWISIPLDLSYLYLVHPLVSHHTSFNHFPRTFSSVF